MRIGYARVSTNDQDLALQEDALRRSGCTQIIVERVARSGPRRAKTGAPELEALLKHIRRGDTLVVWRLDRLAGSVAELLRIIDSLRDRGVFFESLMERIETATAAGRAFMQMVGVFAEYERNLLVERTKAGVAAARARGRVGGRPLKLSKQKQAELKVLLIDGSLSMESIADSLDISKSTLYAYRERLLPKETTHDPSI
ncbi:recombinase family protein (plasmid) [Synechocystis sp. B12]|nr:recombinase family protein [Synechocystis sp. B12]